MEKTRLFRKRIKELDGKIINSIFDLKAEYVLEAKDLADNNLKFIYKDENLIILGDFGAIDIEYLEK